MCALHKSKQENMILLKLVATNGLAQSIDENGTSEYVTSEYVVVPSDGAIQVVLAVPNGYRHTASQ